MTGSIGPCIAPLVQRARMQNTKDKKSVSPNNNNKHSVHRRPWSTINHRIASQHFSLRLSALCSLLLTHWHTNTLTYWHTDTLTLLTLQWTAPHTTTPPSDHITSQTQNFSLRLFSLLCFCSWTLLLAPPLTPLTHWHTDTLTLVVILQYQ
jgi:hypothetical protein